MAINKNMKKSKKDKNKKDKRANWILRFTLVVIAIPVIILAWVLLTSLETTGEPVVGNRFEKQLDPAIKESQVKEVKDALVYPEVENVEVNLKSATLRITIDTIDSANAEQINAIIHDAYAKVNTVLPINTYFTNKDKVKMYDLEISVYNYIPNETNAEGRIYYTLVKTGAATDPKIDVVSTPRNQEATDAALGQMK